MENERKKLTPKQERFCVEYVNSGKAKNAYLAAYDVKEGTKDESVRRSANALLKNLNIASRIEELLKDYREKSELRRKKVLQYHEDVLDGKQIVDHIVKTPKGTMIYMSSKAEAAKQIASIEGFNKAVVEHHGSVEVGYESTLTNEERKSLVEAILAKRREKKDEDG